MSLNEYSKVLYNLFLLLRGIQAADHLLLPHVKLFHKMKTGLELVFLLYFLHDFGRNIFILLYSDI